MAEIEAKFRKKYEEKKKKNADKSLTWIASGLIFAVLFIIGLIDFLLRFKFVPGMEGTAVTRSGWW